MSTSNQDPHVQQICSTNGEGGGLGEGDTDDLCRRLAQTKSDLKHFMVQNKHVFDTVKKLRKDVKKSRSDLLDFLTATDISTSRDTVTGSTFTLKKRDYCTFNKANIIESLGPEAVDLVERKYSQKKDVMVIKEKK